MHGIYNCDMLPALFSNYLLARHALFRNVSALLNFSSCLPTGHVLPAFHFGRESVFGRRPVGLFFKFSFWLAVTKHVLASVTVPGALAGVAWTSVSLCLVD
jgi:hypothetical protein